MDAIVAVLYGLDADDLAWILKDCDHPAELVSNKRFARTLDTKGFWRAEREKDPELRHSVVTQVAFRDLIGFIAKHGDIDSGLRDFLDQNDGDGWLLPETVRLSDYGLGRDERANQPQPVRSRVGERYYPWQLEQNAEESWADCDKHARNLLGSEGEAGQKAEPNQPGSGSVDPSREVTIVPESGSAQRRLFPGEPTLFGDKTEDPV